MLHLRLPTDDPPPPSPSPPPPSPLTHTRFPAQKFDDPPPPPPPPPPLPQLRLQYTYKEDDRAGLPRLDPDAALMRPREAGEPHFAVGLVGAGQVGSAVAEALLRSAGPSPPTLQTHAHTRARAQTHTYPCSPRVRPSTGQEPCSGPGPIRKGPALRMARRLRPGPSDRVVLVMRRRLHDTDT
jgi:hypothetical protein